MRRCHRIQSYQLRKTVNFPIDTTYDASSLPFPDEARRWPLIEGSRTPAQAKPTVAAAILTSTGRLNVRNVSSMHSSATPKLFLVLPFSPQRTVNMRVTSARNRDIDKRLGASLTTAVARLSTGANCDWQRWTLALIILKLNQIRRLVYIYTEHYVQNWIRISIYSLTIFCICIYWGCSIAFSSEIILDRFYKLWRSRK